MTTTPSCTCTTRFMADRAEVERWKQTFSLYFGEVQGTPTPGWLGLHPGQ